MAQLKVLLGELESRHTPRERRQYLFDFPGVSKVFGVRVVSGSPDLMIELPAGFDQEIAKAANPHILLAERLTRAIQILESRRAEFDVLLIFLPDSWSAGFKGGPDEGFDLHDYLKSFTAVAGIPSQVLEAGYRNYPCRCSVMWRLSIALYTKAGGVPWTLADTDPETAFIGISYAMRTASNGNQTYITCCSQIFDADGVGLEFLLYEPRDARIEGKNPFLSRGEMLKVISRSLTLFAQRHAGHRPRHLVVHKSTEFKPEEVQGCLDAWRSSQGLDLIQLQQEVAWQAVKLRAPREGTRGEPDGYPVNRGTYVPLTPRETLMWVQGNAPSASKDGTDFYKEGKGVPRPLLLRRFAGHGGWEPSCRSILGLSKMDWNNDGLYDYLPVTTSFASVLARVVRGMPRLSPKPYSIRYFI